LPLVFSLAFLEAFVGIGLFLSGAVLLSVCSILYLEGIASLQSMVLLAFLGALLSDHCGFYIGRMIGPRFDQSKFAQKHHAKLARTRNTVNKYGVLAIFIGRFLTPIRSIVPLLSGVSGMSRSRYSAYDTSACFLWSLALGGLVIGIDKAFS